MLLQERYDLRNQIDRLAAGIDDRLGVVAGILEPWKNANLSYEIGGYAQKREIVESLTSNRTLERKTLDFTLRTPFDERYCASTLELAPEKRTQVLAGW